ncbi:MAG: iron ABC transporter permease [Planctomycetota bacterium]|nr:iron ABC transporter permease [Planctomycetota bacterium]
MRTRLLGQYTLFLALLAFLVGGLLYPIALTVRGGFATDPAKGTGFTLRHILAIFEDPVLLQGLLNSFSIAAATTALSTIIALPLAVLAARYRYPLKAAWSALVLVPLILPPFVGAIGFKMILGREGALNALLGTSFDILGQARFWGVVVAESLALYPIVYLNATAALANLDPALDEAAENLGAGPIKRFFRITLPLIRPGLFAGGTVVFVWSFTELGTPLMFDYYAVTPVQIFSGIKEVSASAQPYALTIVMLTCSLILYALGKLAFGGRAHAMQSRASRAATEKTLRPAAAFLASALFALITGLALLPHLGVILTSLAVDGSWYATVLPQQFTLSHFEQALGHPLAFGAIKMSLGLASAAVVLNLLLGILIGYVIVRTRIRGRWLLDSLSMLPLAVPGLVMAFGYVAMSLRWPFADGDPLAGWADIVGAQPNPIPLLILAYSVRRLPYVVRATVAGLEQTSGEMEEAAVNLGASTFRAVRSIIIPLIAANLIAGALLAFSFAMLEVSDSLILAQQEKHFPITKAIYTFADRLGDGAAIASAMGVWGMALLTVTLIGASILMGRKLGAIFRV